MESIQHKNILLVDDDEHLLRALDKTLTSEGAVVASTQWAGDAVDFLVKRETQVDLVITDLRMPFVTGMTLVYAIRLMFPSIPVVVLTAYGSPEVKAECFRQGAAAFLEKNLDTPQLLAEIEKVLRRLEMDRRASRKPDAERPEEESVLRERIIHADGPR